MAFCKERQDGSRNVTHLTESSTSETNRLMSTAAKACNRRSFEVINFESPARALSSQPQYVTIVVRENPGFLFSKTRCCKEVSTERHRMGNNLTIFSTLRRSSLALEAAGTPASAAAASTRVFHRSKVSSCSWSLFSEYISVYHF